MNRDRFQAKLVNPPYRAIPQIMKDLRTLQVCIFHPRDEDGESLTKQIERIGCKVHAFWPPPFELPPGTDLVFMAVNPDMINHHFEWSRGDEAPAVIAVVTYENPTIIEAVLRMGAKGVIASPIRSFGILSALVLVQEVANDIRKLRRRVNRLEDKISGMRVLNDAQEILCRQRGISKDEAYRVIRDQAMSKRVTAESIAAAIIQANDLLSFKS